MLKLDSMNGRMTGCGCDQGRATVPSFFPRIQDFFPYETGKSPPGYCGTAPKALNDDKPPALQHEQRQQPPSPKEDKNRDARVQTRQSVRSRPAVICIFMNICILVPTQSFILYGVKYSTDKKSWRYVSPKNGRLISTISQAIYSTVQ